MSQEPKSPHYMESMRDHRHVNGQIVYSGDTPPGGDTTVDSSDFATTTKLPDYASNFIRKVSDKWGSDIWKGYQSELKDLYKTPETIEQGRQAGEAQFASELARTTREGARDLAARQASTGTANSSVGTDQVADLTRQVFGEAFKQHQKNVGAAEGVYKNLVDSAAAAQGFSAMVGEYVSQSQESYSAAFAGMTFEVGDEVEKFNNSNTNGTGSWSPMTGLDPDGTYGDFRGHGKTWSAPKGWKKKSSSGDPDKKDQDTYEFMGQTFYYNEREGTIEGITGQVDAAKIDAKEMAGTAGLEDFAKAKTEEIVRQYGRKGFEDSVNRTAALSNADVGAYGDTLRQQYGGLSDKTLSILRAALGTAGGTGALGAGYGAERGAAIGDVSELARRGIDAQTAQWQAGLGVRQAQDSANANAGLAGQFGSYLGLTRESYKPDVASYLSMYSGMPET